MEGCGNLFSFGGGRRENESLKNNLFAKMKDEKKSDSPIFSPAPMFENRKMFSGVGSAHGTAHGTTTTPLMGSSFGADPAAVARPSNFSCNFSGSSARPYGGVIHHGASCDRCHGNIAGVRYKCAMCPNFDLCESCVDKPGAHDDEHLFLRVVNPDQFRTVPLLFNRSTCTHPGVICAGCNRQGLTGWRYDCTLCGISLCEACEGLGKHDVSHPRLKISTPGC